MEYLKNSLLLIALMCLSCVTKKTFDITSTNGKNGSENFHVVTTSSSHIMQECVFLNAEDENRWRHQYVMYVLNDQKEILNSGEKGREILKKYNIRYLYILKIDLINLTYLHLN